MASFDTRAVLRVDDADRVRLLTFDRPDAKNAFNDALWDATRDALIASRRDPDIAVVVITGAGDAFCAGQDLGEMAAPLQHDDGLAHGYPAFMPALEDFDKPLIAAVNGVGIGIGLTMLAHVDLVLMSETARLRAPFARLGVTAEGGSSVALPLRIGWQETAHLFFAGSWLDAGSAARCGLAWRVCPPDRLLDDALMLAREIARMPISSLVETKRLMLASRRNVFRAAREAELQAFTRLVGSPANVEAVTAFFEKREPDFRGIEGG